MNKLIQPQLPNEKIILNQMNSATLREKEIFLSVLREDCVHPLINGNKWRKLKHNIIKMHELGKQELLTFGGAFSNHIHAVAAAGKTLGFNTRAMIRTHALDINNPTLQFATLCGMQLHAVDRAEYKLRHDMTYLADLQQKFPNAYIVPEGGTNEFAVSGCAELAASLPEHDVLVCPTGSGGTIAGLIEGSPIERNVIGVAVLKQAEYLNEVISKLSQKAKSQTNWTLLCDHHDGGYGKFSPQLWQFCQQFTAEHNIPLEPVYSGKMMYALWQLIEQDYFAPNTHIIAMHTGGLQGLEGLKYRGVI